MQGKKSLFCRHHGCLTVLSHILVLNCGQITSLAYWMMSTTCFLTNKIWSCKPATLLSTELSVEWIVKWTREWFSAQWLYSILTQSPVCITNMKALDFELQQRSFWLITDNLAVWWRHQFDFADVYLTCRWRHVGASKNTLSACISVFSSFFSITIKKT